MRINRSISVLGLLLLVCIIVSLFRTRTGSQEKENETPTITNNAPVAGAKTNAGGTNANNAPSSVPVTGPSPGLAEKLGIPADRLNNIIEQWNSPIDFYGKVIDENDRP